MAETLQPIDRYQSNFERFSQRLQSIYSPKYSVHRKNEEIVSIYKTMSIKVGKVYVGQAKMRATSHGPMIFGPWEQAVYEDVTFELEISLNNEGLPIIQKKMKHGSREPSQLNWHEKKVALLEKSFNTGYRSANELRVIIEGTYYYWKKINGRLVLSEIS